MCTTTCKSKKKIDVVSRDPTRTCSQTSSQGDYYLWIKRRLRERSVLVGIVKCMETYLKRAGFRVSTVATQYFVDV